MYTFVATDGRPVIGHHLRGAKMALWLDLIPKIHRSDNLDERFHLLDDFDDVDSFDADGVDRSRLDRLQRIYATSTTMPPTDSVTTAPRAGNSVARTHPPPPRPSPLPSRPRPTSTARPPTSRTNSDRSTLSHLLRSLFARGREGSVPLGVTIAVGCGLLFLNVLVFAAIFYQREKATRDVREWRRRRRTDTGSSAGDDDDDPADKYFDEAQDSFSETARSGGGGGGAGDTDSNSSLSVALCPSKIGASTGDDNDAHLYRTHLQQAASHHQQRSALHNDVHLATLAQSSVSGESPYESVTRGCCRRSSPCRFDSSAAAERRAAPTILKDPGRRQPPHGVQSPPPPPPPASQSPAAVSVVVSNHSHSLQCYDDNPSTTV